MCFPVTIGGGVSYRKFKRNLRKQHQYNVKYSELDRQNAYAAQSADRDVAYGQSLAWAPQIEAANTKAHYQAMRDSGLHPAFSAGGQSQASLIGGSVGGSSEAYPSQAGSSRGDGVYSAKLSNPQETAFREAQIGLIKAQTDEVLARAEASRAARIGQGVNQVGAVEVVPDQVTSADPHDRDWETV